MILHIDHPNLTQQHWMTVELFSVIRYVDYDGGDLPMIEGKGVGFAVDERESSWAGDEFAQLMEIEFEHINVVASGWVPAGSCTLYTDTGTLLGEPA